MAYRETDTVRLRKEDTRDAILHAARARIAAGGYQNAQMQNVAADAGIATGTVYRYFDSKAELFAQVFRRVVQHEVDAVAAAAAGTGTAGDRLTAVVETFMRRALAAPRLAFALLAEPVDPRVETERLVFRRSYARVIADVVLQGIEDGEFAPQGATLAATALVGVLSETLVGPLSPEAAADRPRLPENELVEAIAALCLRAVCPNQREVTTP